MVVVLLNGARQVSGAPADVTLAVQNKGLIRPATLVLLIVKVFNRDIFPGQLHDRHFGNTEAIFGSAVAHLGASGVLESEAGLLRGIALVVVPLLVAEDGQVDVLILVVVEYFDELPEQVVADQYFGDAVSNVLIRTDVLDGDLSERRVFLEDELEVLLYLPQEQVADAALVLRAVPALHLVAHLTQFPVQLNQRLIDLYDTLVYCLFLAVGFFLDGVLL